MSRPSSRPLATNKGLEVTSCALLVEEALDFAKKAASGHISAPAEIVTRSLQLGQALLQHIEEVLTSPPPEPEPMPEPEPETVEATALDAPEHEVRSR
jgi:hypothetical protein